MTRNENQARTLRTKGALVRLVLVGAAFAASAAAQMFPPQDGDLAARIPFAFTLGETEVPAGEYLLRVNADGSVLLCEDGVYCNVVRDVPVGRKAETSALVFAETADGPRFAGLGTEAVAPCDGLRTVASRKLHIDRFGGEQLAMAWH